MADHYQHNCIEELTADHETILEKLAEIERVIGASSIDKDKIENFLHFTENFAEPHHQKEETVLYPALEKKGIPREGGPIGVMLFEHETKRGYVKALERAFKNNEEEGMRINAKNIISLLRDHIFKEDNVLYPLARNVLTEDELIGLSHQCEKIKGI